MGTVSDNYENLKGKAKDRYDGLSAKTKYHVHIGSATCENAAGANDVCKEMTALVECNSREDVTIKRVGCTGQCSIEPIVSIIDNKGQTVKYSQVDVDFVKKIFDEHITEGKPLSVNVVEPDERQLRLALRNSGVIDPECLADYIDNGGYQALTTVLEKNDPQWVIEQIKISNLRGRGGGG
ncbi:MAG: hypothetical protein MI892_08725, partial [Desulfobacterales bacterium]|nr:hypothetical protein [Desulfobacterales bacterium]